MTKKAETEKSVTKRTPTKEYGFNIYINHVVYVQADSIEEAEEAAFDQFSDDAGFWDDVDMDLFSEEEI